MAQYIHNEGYALKHSLKSAYRGSRRQYHELISDFSHLIDEEMNTKQIKDTGYLKGF